MFKVVSTQFAQQGSNFIKKVIAMYCPSFNNERTRHYTYIYLSLIHTESKISSSFCASANTTKTFAGRDQVKKQCGAHGIHMRKWHYTHLILISSHYNTSFILGIKLTHRTSRHSSVSFK